MNTLAVPMKSARISEGVYEVLGTSTGCTVERANGEGFNRWRLFSDGRFVRHFRTKLQALIYCQEHPEL